MSESEATSADVMWSVWIFASFLVLVAAMLLTGLVALILSMPVNRFGVTLPMSQAPPPEFKP